VKYWKIIADNPSKASATSAGSQRLIPTGERSGLLTRTAATEDALLRADEILSAFVELERQVLTFYLESIKLETREAATQRGDHEETPTNYYPALAVALAIEI
jgi:hypothetical protein